MSPLNVPTPITHWVYTKVWGLCSAGIFWIVACHPGRSCSAAQRLGSGTWPRVATTLQQFSQVSLRALITVGAYCGCSVLCALAGILYSGFVQIPYYGMGDPFLFEAVAGAVIGGLAFTGGEGSFVGTLVGVLFIVTLNQFMSALNVSAGVVDLIYGGVILFALTVSGPGSNRWKSRKKPAPRGLSAMPDVGPMLYGHSDGAVPA